MPYPQYQASVPLVWRSDVCAHLRVAGRCPAGHGQVLVSQRMAALSGWHAGQQVASGVPRRTLRRAVLTEMGLVLGFGTVVGVAAGLLAAVLALRTVPEFVVTPAVPPLSYVPPATPLVVLLGAAVALLAVVTVTSSILLIRGVSPDQLRETPV
jgi:hypothetical protein